MREVKRGKSYEKMDERSEKERREKWKQNIEERTMGKVMREKEKRDERREGDEKYEEKDEKQRRNKVKKV